MCCAQTLYCGNVVADQMVQVTRGGVRLVGAGGRGLLAEWRPPPGLQVNVASASASQAPPSSSTRPVRANKLLAPGTLRGDPH